ncbi:unnamed protein product [Moneuplotes crassus]|uniref:Uncharacterized protein n=1 Tax=Euplotes crassus TaxID=5936 RepID=A0AAD1UFY5_EUPCR|nr:unnamed protein product [Moneuplotes crassus]
MNAPNCGYEGCDAQSVYYIKDKKLYACTIHRNETYSWYEGIVLVNPDQVMMTLNILDTSRKRFHLAAKQEAYHLPEDDCVALSEHLWEKIEALIAAHGQYCRKREYYKFVELQSKVKKLAKRFRENRLFIKTLLAKDRAESRAILEGDKDPELIYHERKLKDNARFFQVVQKLKEQRRNLTQKYQNDIVHLQKTLAVRDAEIADLRDFISRQEQQLTKKHEQDQSQLLLKQEEQKFRIRECIEGDSTNNQNSGILQGAVKIHQHFYDHKVEDISDNPPRFGHGEKKASRGVVGPFPVIHSAYEESKDDIEENPISNVNNNYFEHLNKKYYSYEDLEALQLPLFHAEEAYGEFMSIEFDFSTPESNKLLENIEKTLPDLFSVKFKSISLVTNPEAFKTFCKDFFPDQVEHLTFSLDYRSISQLDKYFSIFIELCQKVKVQVEISECCISQKQLERIICANKSKMCLKITDCYISVENVHYFLDALEGATLGHLDLTNSGKNTIFGSLTSLEDYFLNLVISLSKSDDFRNNLSKVTVTGTGMTDIIAQHILDMHGFKNAKVG